MASDTLDTTSTPASISSLSPLSSRLPQLRTQVRRRPKCGRRRASCSAANSAKPRSVPGSLRRVSGPRRREPSALSRPPVSRGIGSAVTSGAASARSGPVWTLPGGPCVWPPASSLRRRSQVPTPMERKPRQSTPLRLGRPPRRRRPSPRRRPDRIPGAPDRSASQPGIRRRPARAFSLQFFCSRPRQRIRPRRGPPRGLLVRRPLQPGDPPRPLRLRQDPPAQRHGLGGHAARRRSARWST